jgi:hypothetical protein
VALSRIDVAVVAVIAAGMLWIEHGHRIVVATPAVAEAAGPAASLCPDTDDVPFSADCIKFIDGGVLPDIHARKHVAVNDPAAASDVHVPVKLHVPACPPSNENAPYSAACIRFMSGWFWHADSAEDASD